MKNEQNDRILHDICPKKYFSLNFGGQFLTLKLTVSGLDPNTNYVIMVDIVLRAQCASLRYFTALALMHTPVTL